LDIETLAAQPNAALVSLGACKFDWTGKILDKFYTNIDALDCKKYGLVISQSTLDWWGKQSKEARRAWQVDAQPLKESLMSFNDWVGDLNHEMWCNGANFDYPILEEAYIRTGLEKPWKYYNLNDLRTVNNLFNIDMRKMRAEEEPDTYHNALGDALFQTKVLVNTIGSAKLG
jgi:hypothetical protein